MIGLLYGFNSKLPSRILIYSNAKSPLGSPIHYGIQAWGFSLIRRPLDLCRLKGYHFLAIWIRNRVAIRSDLGLKLGIAIALSVVLNWVNK